MIFWDSSALVGLLVAEADTKRAHSATPHSLPEGNDKVA